MKMTPSISVIMSVYNGESYLEEAIESILGQSFGAWELVVINDCSTDSTADILAAYAARDPRIKVYPNEVNLGLQKSLNRALTLCEGQYIARMDADDICLPQRLERQFEFMESHLDVAISSCRFLTVKNGVYASGGCGGRHDHEAIKARLLVSNPILHPGVIARADVLKSLGYDDTLTCTEDLEMWIRLVKNGYRIRILPDYLMIYRLHDKQITSTTLARQHREVLGIEKDYFAHTLAPMTEEEASFYISGIYFREEMNTDAFCAFHRRMKAVNKKKKYFTPDALSYAFFEIFAEYRRRGVTKKQLFRMLCGFDPLFLLKEILRRKRRAKVDGRRCIRAADTAGLVRTGGTDSFPIFAKEDKQELIELANI